ncbi:unnamed protein product, partial [Closterium sp. NIES-54]
MADRCKCLVEVNAVPLVVAAYDPARLEALDRAIRCDLYAEDPFVKMLYSLYCIGYSGVAHKGYNPIRRGASGGSVSCPYVIRTGDRAGQTCGKAHTQHRCISCLHDACRAEFGDKVKRPHWAELLRSEAAALGASESVLPGTAPAEALHTFTLDSGASRCFFHDSTTLTPLPTPVPIRLADPSEGPDVARSSTVLPCPAILSGSLSGLHLPLFSTNLVSIAALQDAMVTTTTPGGQRLSTCTCTWTGRHLATFNPRPGSSLFTLATEPPQEAASAQLRLLGQGRVYTHCHVHSSPSTAPLCLPCVEGWQRAAPHSSSLPPTTGPLQTLHMDVWGPARVSGQGRERYFMLVVVDYTRYTTVFPLQSKGQVVDVLIPWIRAVRLQLRERFRADLPVLRLHSDRGGEFSSDLLLDICRGEGILQSFTLLDSFQQNGIAERRIGLVMEVARTSMIHVAAPHFLWPFATLPTLRWTGKVGDASVFRVWGSRAFVRDMSADKLSARAIPCVFLGFSLNAPGWQFYHPTSRRVFPSQDVTFDESVPFYRLFPYRSAPPLPPPLFLASGPPLVAVGSGASRGAVSGGAEPGVAESEGAGSRGAEPGGEEPGGAEPAGVDRGGAEPEGVEHGGAESEGAESGGAEPQGAASSGGAGGAGFAGAGGAGVTAGAGGTGGTAATDPTEPGAAGAGGSGAGGAGAGGAGAGGIGAGGAGAGGTDAGDARVGGTGAGGAGAGGAGGVDRGGTVRPVPYFVPLLQQVLGVSSSTSLTPPLLCPPPDQSQLPLQPASPLPAPSPYIEQFGSLTECCEPASCPVSPVRTARHVPHSRPPPVPGTHAMALRPFFHCSHYLSSPHHCSLDTESDPSFESTVASARIAELLDFAAACHPDYATALVAES